MLKGIWCHLATFIRDLIIHLYTYKEIILHTQTLCFYKVLNITEGIYYWWQKAYFCGSLKKKIQTCFPWLFCENIDVSLSVNVFTFTLDIFLSWTQSAHWFLFCYLHFINGRSEILLHFANLWATALLWAGANHNIISIQVKPEKNPSASVNISHLFNSFISFTGHNCLNSLFMLAYCFFRLHSRWSFVYKYNS